MDIQMLKDKHKNIQFVDTLLWGANGLCLGVMVSSLIKGSESMLIVSFAVYVVVCLSIIQLSKVRKKIEKEIQDYESSMM